MRRATSWRDSGSRSPSGRSPRTAPSTPPAPGSSPRKRAWPRRCRRRRRSWDSSSRAAPRPGRWLGVRRESGGVPRSTQGGGGAAAAASQSAVTRTPGAHLRVSFARPDHPIAYGYSARTHVFRQNFTVYSIPRRWLRMAYCTTCLDGPLDRSGVVLEWGDREGAPLVVSGQAWGGEGLIGHPAILDL